MYFLGYSKNRKVRRYSTSGGFTKEILAHALRSGYVDYLVFPRKRGVDTEIVVTRSADELFTPATNSVYDQCNPLSGVSEVPAESNIGISLLPCHVGAREKMPQLRFVVEILCDYTQPADYAQRICSKFGVKTSDVEELYYRTGTWPGKTTIVLRDGTVLNRPWGKYWLSDPVLDSAPRKCPPCSRICAGGDVVVADPWRLEKKWKGPGKTMFRVMNPDILPMIHEANVEIESIQAADWERSLAPYIRRKAQRCDTSIRTTGDGESRS